MRICRILKMHLRILLVCYLYCSVLNVKRPYLSKPSEYLCQSKDEVNTILAELAITYQNAHGQNPDWLDISTDRLLAYHMLERSIRHERAPSS